MIGGTEADRLTGGAGFDRFVFSFGDTFTAGGTRDIITDYTVRIDRLDVSRIDTNQITGFNDAFTIIGTAGIGLNTPGQIRYQQAGGIVTYVALNTDNGNAAEALIELAGLKILTAADFVL